MPCVYEKAYSPLHSLFVFQMQKKQKGQERFGQHHNTEVTFCVVVDVLLFFSYCLVHVKNEIKPTLMPREGQRLCWDRWLFERTHAYICTLPLCFEGKLPCLLSPCPSQKATFNFLLETNEISYLSLLTLPSSWESCYLMEVTEACLVQSINRVGG